MPINRDDLAITHPKTEKGILIAQGWFGLSPETCPLPISNLKIHPLYFGFYLNEGSWELLSKNERFIRSMKSYEPIGCRDFGSRDYLRSLGVKAYFSGCMTMTIEKRKQHPYENKTFLIDALNDVNQFIPENLRKNCVYLSQEGTFPSGVFPICDEDVEKIDAMAYERLQQLKSEATFVITSRIHTAMPCVAMGIPVVFTFTQLDNPRVSIIKNYLPMYDETTFHSINWNHPVPDTENFKKQMRQMFLYQLQRLEHRLGLRTNRLTEKEQIEAQKLIKIACDDDNSPIPKQSVHNYCKKDFLSSLFDKKKSYLLEQNKPLVLFGAGSAGKHLSKILQYFDVMPDFVCDNRAKKDNEDFCNGVPIITFDTLKNHHKNSIVFITTIKGLEPIYRQLIKNGFERDHVIKNPILIQKYAHFLVPSDTPIK